MPRPRPIVSLALLLPLLGCGGGGDERCPEWPSEPSEIPGVIDSDAYDCGYWALPVGEHLYVNVYVSDELAECSDQLDPGAVLNAQPTWSNFSGGGMKWTYDLVGETASSDWLAFEVSCSDGGAFSARLLVEP